MGRHFPRNKVGVQLEKPQVKYWDKDAQRFVFRDRKKPGRKPRKVTNEHVGNAEG